MLEIFYIILIEPGGPYLHRAPAFKTGVVPSIFAWNKDRVVQKRRSVTEKLEAIRAKEEEETDTASEGEGDIVTNTVT